jgi:TolB-like protein/tetratricopeptide (TPR) repeat protein
VVIVFALGFVPALIISWAYELTSEGLKREKDVVREASITHFTAKRLDGITIGLIVVALVFIVTDRFWLSPRQAEQAVVSAEVVTENVQTSETDPTAPQYPLNSIAVLPFVNMSDDASNEYFSDGISEELLNLLSKVPDLRVISRSSSFSFKDKDVDIPTIAAQLNVAYVLEGSVRKAGNQVRITAQLIEVHSDSHLWSETFDRELENIFVVQDEISTAIVGVLMEQLGLQVEVAPRAISAANTEAHDAYLRGRHLVVQRTRASVGGAVREFKKAIALDPGYALAHAELAMATSLQIRSQYGDLTEGEAMAGAAPHAEQAMALDPNLAESHAATGFVLWDDSEEEAQAHFRQAIRINPNYSIVYNWLGMLLDINLGRYNEAFAMYEVALQLDPLSLGALTSYIWGLMERHRLDEAGRELEKFVSIAPEIYAEYGGYLTSLGGQWANLVLTELDALLIDPETSRTRSNLSSAFAAIGLEKESLAIYETPQPGVLSMMGKPPDAVTTAQARVAEDPRTFNQIRLGVALAGTGDYVHARPILEEMWQRSAGRVARGSQFQIAGATALITIRLEADEEAGVNELVAAIQDNVLRYREAGMTGTGMTAPIYLMFDVDYEAGLAAYLTGEHEQGLALIAKAAENGYFIMPSEAYLQTLYDDPGFVPIREMQEARQARERDKFLTIVCTDNPYEAVWQPAEGTCERFAAEQKNDSLQ